MSHTVSDKFTQLLVVIFITRTWAIWERSRPILLFLIGLAIVRTVVDLHEWFRTDLGDWRLWQHQELQWLRFLVLRLLVHGFTSPCSSEPANWRLCVRTVTSCITLVVEGVGQYQILITAAKYPWIVFIPFLLILIFQSGTSGCWSSGYHCS